MYASEQTDVLVRVAFRGNGDGCRDQWWSQRSLAKVLVMPLSLLDLPWWGYVLVTLVLTHVTIAAVTIFLHRHQAHRALALHPIVSHFFRFWLWLTTGMATKEWVAIHRKHHASCETAQDPHSPQIHGIRKVLFEGTELYRTEAATRRRSRSTAAARPTTGSSAICTRKTAARRGRHDGDRSRPVRPDRTHRCGRCRCCGSRSSPRAWSTASATTGVIATSRRTMPPGTSCRGAS